MTSSSMRMMSSLASPDETSATLSGKPVNTPHYYFVDNGITAEVYERYDVLGESDLKRRQDPVSWDKLLDMIVNYANVVLGHHVNTRKMIVSTTQSYLAQLLKMLEYWHSKRQSFTIIDEIAPLIGKLNHMAQMIRCMNHLMGHLYTSLSCALTKNKRHLITTNKQFASCSSSSSMSLRQKKSRIALLICTFRDK
ncbi:LOW QUALITY PROTEIN: hypothetical protein ACHAWO_003662 [Cyclotella atomus]|uniref:Uncharacterized protein n=1 Tax=Cyclotella atomus TaxID=382360 RepID=A0ABD3PR06_9STRA